MTELGTGGPGGHRPDGPSGRDEPDAPRPPGAGGQVEAEYLPERQRLLRHYVAAANLLAAATAMLTVTSLTSGATVVAGLSGEEAQRALVEYGLADVSRLGPNAAGTGTSVEGAGGAGTAGRDDSIPFFLLSEDAAEAAAAADAADADAGGTDAAGNDDGDEVTGTPFIGGRDTITSRDTGDLSGIPDPVTNPSNDDTGTDDPDSPPAPEVVLTTSTTTPLFDGVVVSPGRVLHRCFLLTYDGGSETAETVLAVDAGGALGAHLLLTVETGRGTTAVADCSGFVRDTELASGTADALASAHGASGSPAGPVTMSPGAPVPIRVTSALPGTTPESVQGLTAWARLTWTATAG